MALPATHIRFAIDLKDRFKILDIGQYVSGTVYPDSRYVTGLERKATHPQEAENWDLNTCSDFRKGWYVHLLCDQLQKRIMLAAVPSAFEGDKEAVWVQHTALKVLQDDIDIAQFDIKFFLGGLDYAEAASGENLADLQRYNKALQTAYQDNIRAPSLITDLGINEEMQHALNKQIEIYRRDPVIMEAILGFYDKMIAEV
ncbi:MAG: hypothetical protein KC582_04025 [Candidatus Magasanikbacteria bacterium]|nr:hypothetical protein [Candidatus Magasanikbacteria bacterium]